jgi:hypothetical protein
MVRTRRHRSLRPAIIAVIGLMALAHASPLAGAVDPSLGIITVSPSRVPIGANLWLTTGDTDTSKCFTEFEWTLNSLTDPGPGPVTQPVVHPDAAGNVTIRFTVDAPGTYEIVASCQDRPSGFFPLNYNAVQFTAYDPAATTSEAPTSVTTTTGAAPPTTAGSSTTTATATPVEASPSFAG